MNLRKAYLLLAIVYIAAILIGILASIPMIMHVAPYSKCLLFAYQTDESLHHGHHASCSAVGYGQLLVILGAIISLIMVISERQKLTGQHLSLYEHMPIRRRVVVGHTFWMIASIFLGILTTIGYHVSCNNFEAGIRKILRDKLSVSPYDTRGEDIQTRFEDDYRFHRYTSRYGNAYGAEHFSISITCRSLFLDPEIHQKLHDTHVFKYSSYFGYFYETDLHAYRNDATEVNTMIESSLAGGWLAIVIWIAGFILIFIYRYQLQKRLTEEDDRVSMHSAMSLGYAVDGSQFRKDGSIISGKAGSFQRGCPSRGSDRSIRSTRSMKRDIDEIALSLHRANGLTGSMATLNPTSAPPLPSSRTNSGSLYSRETGYVSGNAASYSYKPVQYDREPGSLYNYRDEMETEIF